MSFQILPGDCLEVLAEMPESSVDAIVTDPPYGLEFMGKEWDAPWRDGKASREWNEIEKGSLGGFTKLPNHSRVNNVKCQKCDRWKFSSRPCQCKSPQFPNARRAAMLEFQLWTEAWATELLRVLKPGGHLLAFGGTRTYHRLASGIEDAGFEIRDCLAWMYGSGFPKSLDVSKAIDKAAGAEREVVGPSYKVPNAQVVNPHFIAIADQRGEGEQTKDYAPTAPATEAARQWQGWGTALKPAYEPVILARKPLTGTVAANVQEFGTGALNVDGCRVPSDDTIKQVTGKGILAGSSDGWDRPWKNDPEAIARRQERADEAIQKANDLGRWPANLILDEEAGAMLDEQSGETGGGHWPNAKITGYGDGIGTGVVEYNGPGPKAKDTGGASRFFYTAKASRAERNAGLDGFEERETGSLNMRSEADGHAVRTGQVPQARANVHPTVKPIDLMRYLVRLVTPPGGTVLDPFTGSGTTGIAAGLEGFDFVGIEREAEYREIAEARLKWWADKEGETVEILRRAGLAEKERERAERVGQASLFEDAA